MAGCKGWEKMSRDGGVVGVRVGGGAPGKGRGGGGVAREGEEGAGTNDEWIPGLMMHVVGLTYTEQLSSG